jgi:hypothetical protein
MRNLLVGTIIVIVTTSCGVEFERKDNNIPKHVCATGSYPNIRYIICPESLK